MGIAAVQKGSTDEGARLIRIAIKSGDLSPQMRAIAYLWLGETQSDPQQKRASYGEALAADPNNAEARTRLASLLTQQLPSSSPARTTETHTVASVTATPAQDGGVNIADHVAHIIGGPNGPGTAFFVSQDGLLATTRHVVGGLQKVTVELHIGRQLQGTVVRAYTDLDLTLVHVDHNPGSLLPITPLPRVPDETPLTIVTYNGEIIRSSERPTNRVMAAHWIPTSAAKLLDAGGNPIFDERNYLVGMMTKNTSRTSGHMFALHIAAIRRMVDTFVREARTESRVYCPECGNASRAVGAGFFYCEQCGSTTPPARSMNRYPIPQADPYYETGRIRCTVCGSMAGMYNNICVRCGQPQGARPQP
jgi:hypothetical protein